jgi:L-amino acid N-acyltransferase
MSILVRDGTADDLPATLAIYNELIDTTTIAWTDRHQTLAERGAWFADQQRRGFPVLVADDDGEVVGVTAYGDFRDSIHWAGYRHTVELSIHVRGDRRQSGIGRLLMNALVERARNSDVHVMVAGIDADNIDSILFHQRMQFVEVARMPETGRKFGRWLDLVLMQRILDA